jgi:hypothetical protein
MRKNRKEAKVQRFLDELDSTIITSEKKAIQR